MPLLMENDRDALTSLTRFTCERTLALLTAIKVVEYRDVDYETAKKEVSGYFRMKGEAYASDASSDLELDYELKCKIMDELENKGQSSKKPE